MIEGPWEAQEERIDRNTGTEAAVLGPDGDVVALVYGNLGMDEEAIERAKIIAMAPAMYKAIKEYLEWGAMTGSDRDLHEDAFKKAINFKESP